MLPPLKPLLTSPFAAPLSDFDSPAVVALGVLAFCTLLLLALSVQLLRTLRAERAASAQRHAQLCELLAGEVQRLERRLVAQRNESATFLEAIFTGVQGLARNLDAARSATVETLEEVRHQGPASQEGRAPQARPLDAQPAVEPRAAALPREERRGRKRL